MKTLRNKIAQIATAVLLGMGSVMVSEPTTAQNIQISYNDFYQELSPYGYWFNDPMYGYVWQPNNVGQGFRPYYTNGYWAMTEYGNMWVSNYQWGWATFHYGRWALTNYGWVWVPGTEWAPAWVDWRQGNGYYGWAPMAPGVSINIYFGSGYNTPYDWFTFVPYRNIYNRNFNYYSPPRAIRNFNNFSRITHTYRGPRNSNMYAYGPRANEIRQHTKRDVPVYSVREANTRSGPRVSGNTVTVYQPRVNASTTAAPRNVRNIDAATSSNSRVTSNNQRNDVVNNEAVNRSNNSSRNTQVKTDNSSRVNQATRNNTSSEVVNRQAQQRAAQEQALRAQQQAQQAQQRAAQEQAARAQQQAQQRAAQEQAARAQQQAQQAQQRAAQEQASRARNTQSLERTNQNRTMNNGSQVQPNNSQRSSGGQSRVVERR